MNNKKKEYQIKKQIKWKNCLGELFNTKKEAETDNKSLYMVAKAHIPRKIEFYEDAMGGKHKTEEQAEEANKFILENGL